jgi:hypothetical protein
VVFVLLAVVIIALVNVADFGLPQIYGLAVTAIAKIMQAKCKESLHDMNSNSSVYARYAITGTSQGCLCEGMREEAREKKENNFQLGIFVTHFIGWNMLNKIGYHPD